MAESVSLMSPQHWPSWLAVGLVRVLACLPYQWQMRLGGGLGTLARWLLKHRRHVVRTNIALAFPGYTPVERERILREHFRCVGRAIFETAICWWGNDDTIQRLAHIEGAAHLRDAVARGKGIILLSAHFTPLELGVRMGQIQLRDMAVKTTAMYKPPHDPVINHVMRTRREAHIGGQSIPHKDIKGFLRALKHGHAVWYAGDQRAPGRQGQSVPFFGQPAMTHVAISRLARMTGATVVPFFTLRREDGRGYRMIVRKPLNDFPGADATADATRINALIEAVVRQAPAQYFWLHERFRTPDHNPYSDDSA